MGTKRNQKGTTGCLERWQPLTSLHSLFRPLGSSLFLTKSDTKKEKEKKTLLFPPKCRNQGLLTSPLHYFIPFFFYREAFLSSKALPLKTVCFLKKIDSFKPPRGKTTRFFLSFLDPSECQKTSAKASSWPFITARKGRF